MKPRERKSKLMALADELLPELGHIVTEPSGAAMLAFSSSASPGCRQCGGCVREADRCPHLSAKHLALLQELACTSIGSKEVGRICGLIVEQHLFWLLPKSAQIKRSE